VRQRRSVLILLFVAAGALLWGGRASAQNVPSPEEAARLLELARQNPAVAEQIRQRIRQSGLTPDQVRARLRASGYPEALLDAYLGPAVPGQALPGALEVAGLQALGVPPIAIGGDALALDTGFIRPRGDPLRPPSLVFGVDVFRRTTTQFLPLLTGPAPPSYRLGPGDVLVLILTGAVENAYTLPVTREGFIVIPGAGQVHVANLTLAELREVLYTRLGRVYSSISRAPDAKTRFHASVATVRAIQVYVVGEVAQPGAYQTSALATVLSALYAAGGITERANLRRIALRRADSAVATLDLYDYLLRGDTKSDVRIESGDVIFVPVHGTRVHVTGAVTRPAIYEFAPGETLADVLRAAGGFRPDAELRRIAVHRVLPARQRGPGPFPRVALDVPLAPLDAYPPAAASSPPVSLSPSLRSGQALRERGDEARMPVAVPPLPLEDGDSVVVDAVPSLRDGYYVAIAGTVRKPGLYPWHPGITLRELLMLARGPRVGAYLAEAEIARLPADRRQGQLATTIRVPLDSTYLFERDSLGNYVGPPGLPAPAGGTPEVPLEPYDNVLILQQPEFAFQRTVVLEGQVRFPGAYSLRTKDDRLADLIERAGGVTERAYAEGIRFFRSEGAAGRINIDLRRALRDAQSRDNVVLQPGDSIVIPEYLPSVRVLGAVTAPGSVLWKAGEGVDYYVDGAGGYAANAAKGRVSVRYANGETRTRRRGLLGTRDPRPGPGSEVFVPAKDPAAGRTDYVGLLGTFAQVLSSMVAMVVVLSR
jgi:protein involved in polysaccharide export with SLBB domain